MSFKSIRSNAFCRSIKHMNAGRLYSIDFSVICLITKMASVQDLPDLNPCCSSASEIRSFILFVIFCS